MSQRQDQTGAVTTAAEIPQLIAAAFFRNTGERRSDPELDEYLDAVEVCVRRYGWSRTSLQDIAQEAGVNRTTIYRLLGSKDAIFGLFAAREVRRLSEWAARCGQAGQAKGAPTTETLIEVAAGAIERVRSNPTTAKLLADEPELVASFMRNRIPEVIERFIDLLGPLLAAAMEEGRVARRDPRLMTEWVVRICLSLLFAPPRGDLRELLAVGVRPLFEVAPTDHTHRPGNARGQR